MGSGYSDHSHIIEGIEASARNGLFSVSFEFSCNKENIATTTNYLYKQGYNWNQDGNNLVITWRYGRTGQAKKMYELASKFLKTYLFSKLNDAATLGTLTGVGSVSDYFHPSNSNLVAHLKKEGIDCTFRDDKVICNWKYSTTGKGRDMRRKAEQVLWDKVMSVLDVEFASKILGMSYVMPHRLNAEQLKTLQTKYFIEYRNNAFVYMGKQPNQYTGEKNLTHKSPSAPPDGSENAEHRPHEGEKEDHIPTSPSAPPDGSEDAIVGETG